MDTNSADNLSDTREAEQSISTVLNSSIEVLSQEEGLDHESTTISPINDELIKARVAWRRCFRPFFKRDGRWGITSSIVLPRIAVRGARFVVLEKFHNGCT